MTRSSLLRLLLLGLALALVPSANAFAFGQLGGVNTVGGGPSDTAYQLDGPSSLLSIGDGSYFVLDSANSKVIKLDSSGKLIAQFGGPGSGLGRLVLPTAVATVGGGATPDLVVVQGTATIKRFTSAGVEVASFGTYGTGNGQFSSPSGVVVDPSCGDLFVTDAPNSGGRVQRFSLGGSGAPSFGTHLETFGLGAGISEQGQAGKLWYPRGMAFSSDGQRLFVVDSANRRIQTFTWSGNCGSRTFSPGPSLGSAGLSLANYLESPFAVAVDSSVSPARIYTSLTYLHNTIKLFTATGALNDPTAGPYNIAGDPSDNDPPVAEWGTIVPYGTEPGSGVDDLYYPSSIVASGQNMLVTESNNNRIHRYAGVSDANPFTPPTSLAPWGMDARQDGYFKSLGNLAAAPDGGFYAIDTVKYRIQRFSAGGDLVDAWGNYSAGGEDGTFQNSPSDLAVAPDGSVWVSDSSNNRLQHFSAAGVHIGNIAGGSNFYPGPIDIDGFGNLWIYEWGDRKVVKMAADGTPIASFGSQGTASSDDSLDNPADLAVSADGKTVNVLDGGRQWVKRFTSTDGVSYAWDSTSSAGSGSGDGQLAQPQAIDINPVSGELAIANRGNNRVELLNSDFSFGAKFGSYGFDVANLIAPTGLGFDQWGNLWVADQGNDSVKRYGNAPAVSITSPAAGSTTTAASTSVTYEVTDPAATCTLASGVNVDLAYGANTINVECSNAEGSGSASVVVTRPAPDIPGPPANPGTPADEPDVALQLPKQLKLSKSGKVRFAVTCRVECAISAKLKVGKKTYRVKTVALVGKDAAQSAQLKLDRKSLKKVRAALKAKKRVRLDISVTAKGAKQGKSGSAILKR